VGGHRVWLRFDDRVEGDTDLANELDGGVFEPLRDPDHFARFTVDDTLQQVLGRGGSPRPPASSAAANSFSDDLSVIRLR
jgi:hypothetical protein